MKITIETQKPKEEINDLFGLFFEDLNHAADGGLYAELIQNRSFEFEPIDNKNYHSLTAWEKIEKDGTVNLNIESSHPISSKNPHYLVMESVKARSNVGVQNIGFGEGIPLKESAVYDFTCYAKVEQGTSGAINVSLRGQSGEVYCEKQISLTEDWKKYELGFISPITDYAGRLAITTEGTSKVYLDFVSLFPRDTYKGRKNGVRKDIAELLEEMHPKFMRFPGGCLVHDGSLNANDRDSMYRWKNTIGPLEHRPATRNNWGYNQTLGLGYYELFQLCEDIGAKPLPVMAAGYDPHHKRAVPMEEMQEWIDDALDLIEFANGAPETKWGAIRTQMGHPTPFGMEYLGIGNEEVGEDFFPRFEVIYRAVREKYPEIKLIGTSGPFASGTAYDRGWESAIENGADLVDEHYYQSPEWFLANHHRYDNFKKENPKVFLGEYATWGNTWYNALVEASFMIGLERNTHAVGMACYAPMLANVDYVNWKPDMIWFNNHQVYGTPNYYVQKLFMNYLGKYQLQTTMEEMPEAEVLSDTERIVGKIELLNNESEVEYFDIIVTNDDTKEQMTFSNCRLGIEEKTAVCLTEMNAKNYTIRLKAVEKQGYKGFRIYFGSWDVDNNFCWTLGGWQNQDNIIAERINGRESVLGHDLWEVEKDRVYDLILEVRGRTIKAYVDGVLYQEVESKPTVIEALYTSTQETEDGDIIFKAVNVSDHDCEADVMIQGIKEWKEQMVEVVAMEGFEKEVNNSFDNPFEVSLKCDKCTIDPNKFHFVFPKNSIYILKFNSNIEK